MIQEVNLGKKIFKSLKWVGSVNLFSQIFSWAITIVIVRQLSPADFGMMAMALVFWGFLTMIGDFGLYASIVQSKEVTRDQLGEIFGFIVFVNFAFLIIIYFAAPIISNYFSEPHLTAIMRSLSIVFIFTPFYIIPYSLLLREMNFKITSIIDGFCNLCAAITSLLFALNGFGVWSLVYGTITQYFARAVSYIIVSKKYYRPLFRIDHIRGMLSFSSFFTGSTILRYLLFKSDIIIGGRFVGSEALGLYSIANQLAFAPVEKISNIIPEIAFTAFSKMQFDRNLFSANFLKGLKLLNIIIIPSYICIFVLAEDIVRILLGPKWDEIILPMRILCLIMPLRAIDMLFLPAMNGLGKSNIAMILTAISLLIMTLSFLVGINWGYIGLCFAWVGGFTIIYLITISICIRNLEMTATAIVRAYKTSLISSLTILLMGFIVLNWDQNIMHPALKIVAFLALSIFFYTAALFYIDKPVIIYFKNILVRKNIV